jgi:two-component system, chemotaxis family, sensor kinase CheA
LAKNPVVETFVAESLELLEQLETGLLALETGDKDPELIASIFRAAHTIKGGAGLVGERKIVELAHSAENLLDALRHNLIELRPPMIRDLLAAVDQIRAMVFQLDSGETVECAKCDALSQRLSELTKSDEAQVEIHNGNRSIGPRIFRISLKFSENLLKDSVDPIVFFNELTTMGDFIQVDVDTSALPDLESMSTDALYLGWTVYLRTTQPKQAIEATFLFVWAESQITVQDVTTDIGRYIDLRAADKRVGELLVETGRLSEEDLKQALDSQQRVGEILVQQGSIAPKVLAKTIEKQNLLRSIKRTTTLRVDASKVDRLLNLVGELVTAVAQSTLVVMDASSKAATRRATMEHLDRITRDLQDGVTQMRTVPIEELFGRFPRIVRDTAEQLGKAVELITEGAESELDRNLVEKLVDPLKHMIRNALDHGIESPETRRALGKPAKGRLTLAAAHRDGKVVITVSDDGQGIQVEKIRQRAISAGIISEQDELDTRHAYDLLFHPGFTTTDSVSELSGRGVGLDVVRKNVQDLGGSVEIASRLNEGTQFTIRLPLTLAIIDALVVRLGTERIAFPLLNIVELIYPRPEDLRAAEGSRYLVRARGTFVPMAKLSELFGLPAEKTNPLEAMVIILGSEGHRFGIMVDDAVGTYQVVVKSLEPSFEVLGRLDHRIVKPTALAGAAVMPDGTVSLIIDVFGLERMAIEELFRVRRSREEQNRLTEVGLC